MKAGFGADQKIGAEILYLDWAGPSGHCEAEEIGQVCGGA